MDVVEVLVAAEKIEAGTPLEPTLFRKESRPSISLSPTSIRTYDELKGAYAAAFIAAGQPLLSEYVTLRRPVNPIAQVIPDGYRAVTMGVDETTSVEGWARSGAKVDVLLVSSVNNKPTGTVIVQNAKVLSGGGTEQRSDSGKTVEANTVTLLVTADEATKMQLAQSAGHLSLILRGDEDTIVDSFNASLNIDAILGADPNRKDVVAPKSGRIRIEGKEYEFVGGKLSPVKK